MNEDLLARVLEKSREVFVKYGVKSVTMDDISKELGISKKTLYTVVKDKNELIEKTSFNISDDVFRKINKLLTKNLNPINELIEIENIVCDTITNFDPSVIHQFQKYYPAIHKKLHDRQKSAIINMIKENMKRGIVDGLYRDNLNVNFMAHLDYNTSFNLINPDLFSAKEFEIRKIKHDYLIYHLRGISTSKGLSFIEKKITNY
jgi:AcrR family transcriptional regulator